ncbi:MAG: GxxExxY protein [Crocinitomicaceae bacterium]|nr:GxxExxY protein [Crocinitomicaceae bacterium]|tara:strand:- start:2091 stop:2468 length:378 start_codon:yes stop_codon:yes gene_type:complete
MDENRISEIVIGCAIKVHKALGPGLLESAYRECLAYELKKESFKIHQEMPMPIIYEDIKLDHGYRMDILVEDKVVLELKTVEAFTPVHEAQLLTYLKLGDYKLGLLLNFHVSKMTRGIKRMVNKL